MKQTPLVYEVERTLGLEEQVRQGSRLIIASLAQPEDLVINRVGRSIATNMAQPDLFYLKSIMVTAGVVNLNQDYFDPVEAWKARATPEDKQFNFEHNSTDIIGHITDCVAVDDKLALIASDTKASELPNKFHILTTSVIYKYSSDDERQELLDKTIAEIQEGKWYVSMECLFPDFDYLLQDGSKAEIIKRSNETAFLTKHLRAYGGDGKYKGKPLSRVLRNFVFSGKGLVRRPANPESVIINLDDQLNLGQATILNVSDELGYSTKESESKQESMAMANENTEKIETELAELKKQLAKANEQLADNAKKDYEKQVNELKADVAKANDLLKAAQDCLTSEQTKAKELATKVETLTTELSTAQESLTKIAKEKRDADRLAAVKAAFEGADDFSDEDAKAFVTDLEELSDEAFTKAMAKLKAKGYAHKKIGQGTNLGGGAMPEDVTKTVVASEEDKEVAGATLEGAEKVVEPALAATVSDDKVNQVQSEINAFFARPKETKKNSKK